MGLLALVAVALTSCRKEEDARSPILEETVNLNDVYGTKTDEASMGTEYQYQAYYDLGTASNKANIDKLSYELAFASNEMHVELNQAISNLRVARSEQDWENTVSADDLEFGYDLISTETPVWAIGNDLYGVFVMDRGVDELGASRGYRKFTIDYNDGTYTLTSAALNGTDEVILEVPTSDTYTYTYAHLQDGITEVAPRKEEWDIVFTHYLHVFDPETEPFPYQVTGVLLNPEAVWVVELDDADYAAIDWAATTEMTFTQQRAEIGYDWKYFDFDLGFVVDEDRVYVVEDHEGFRYKLRFTSFYNELGEKGHPQFTFQRLQED